MANDETVWIIGASDGIGEALAREWAARGARVILSARSEEKLKSLAVGLGPEHVAVSLDVADRESLDAAARRITELGPIDRVVHLAAAYDPGKIVEIDPVKAAQIVSINLTGSFHIAQVAPSLLREGGQLALCGSVAGYFGLPQGQIYSATKAGVINLAESLRSELKDKVDVRLISPGFVDTRLTRRNNFEMPGMLTPEKAAVAIIDGLAGKRFEIHFPWRFTMGIKFLQLIPYWISLRLTRRLVQ